MTDDTTERPARTRSVTVRLPEAAVEAIEGARRMLGCASRTEAIVALIVAGAEAIAPPDEDALVAAIRAALLVDDSFDAEASRSRTPGCCTARGSPPAGSARGASSRARAPSASCTSSRAGAWAMRDRRTASPALDALAAVDTDALRADRARRDLQARSDLADSIESARLAQRSIDLTMRRAAVYGDRVPELAGHGATATEALGELVRLVADLVAAGPAVTLTSRRGAMDEHRAIVAAHTALDDALARVRSTLEVLRVSADRAARGAARDGAKAEIEAEALRERVADLLRRVEALDATPRAAE